VLLLALVAAASLTPLFPLGAQDVSRVCLSRAIVHGHLYDDACLGTTFAVDRAAYGGHYYSDKAPGMSVLEIPGVLVTGIPNVTEWPLYDKRLWLVRVLAGGLAFLAGVFLVGRISEGLAPGYGGAAIVAYGLGMLVAPLAAANFEHVTAGTLGLAAFALAWRRRARLAGLAAGMAVLVAYEAVLLAAILAVYVLLQGRRRLYDYAFGAVPGIAILCAYDWAAFGAPWHLSYRYVDNQLAAEQAAGFFGIHVPHGHGIQVALAGERGLLAISPVVIAAGYGLALLSRRFRAEAVVSGAVALTFLLLDVGYFDPLGGVSPGARFLVPGLTFLALGLGPAFARRFWVTSFLTAASVTAMTAVTLTWPNGTPGPGTVWGELAGLPAHLGSSRFAHLLVENVVPVGRDLGALLVGASALAALAVILVEYLGRSASPEAPRPAEEPGLSGPGSRTAG
jgi:hypothetical protein